MIGLELCWPAPTDDVEQITKDAWAELLATLDGKNRDYLTLDDLIQFADYHPRCWKLSEELQNKIYLMVSNRMRKPGKVTLAAKINFGLGMWPAMWWASRIHIHPDGHKYAGLVDYCAGQDMREEMKQIRNDILKM